MVNGAHSYSETYSIFSLASFYDTFLQLIIIKFQKECFRLPRKACVHSSGGMGRGRSSVLPNVCCEAKSGQWVWFRIFGFHWDIPIRQSYVLLRFFFIKCILWQAPRRSRFLSTLVSFLYYTTNTEYIKSTSKKRVMAFTLVNSTVFSGSRNANMLLYTSTA